MSSPIRGIFVACCPSAEAQSAKSKAPTKLSAKGKGLSVGAKNLFLIGFLSLFFLLFAPCYFMTLSARASTLGGIMTILILDFRFWIDESSAYAILIT
jgi:hypothetical protein